MIMSLKNALAIAVLAATIAVPASATELIVNGGFETGNYTGWSANVRSGSNGGLSISTPGANSPVSNFATAPNAAGGSFYSVSDQGGPGAYALAQSFFIPVGTTSAVLTFQMFANNSTGVTIIDPIGLDYTGPSNQHARVDILTAGANVFSTNPADVVAGLYLGADGTGANPYVSYSFNLLSLGLSDGTGYQIRFGEVDNQGFFQQGVDNVSIDAIAGAVPEPSTWAMMIAGFGMIGFAARRRQQVKTSVTYA
jgi:PEP-CTERM motif